MGERSSKTQLLIYSGHGEILGGDTKYLFDLIKSLDSTRFELTVYTDVHPNFKSRSEASVGPNTGIDYLDTRPRLFRTTIVDRRYAYGNW